MLAMILFAPNAVLGDLTKIFSSPITFHGYFYHIIVIFQYFLIIAKREYHARNYDFLIFCTFVLSWAIIAVPFAFKFNANYMGIIKPFIPFFQRLLQYYGYPVYLLTYFLCVYTISFFITISYKKVCNLRPKKATLPWVEPLFYFVELRNSTIERFLLIFLIFTHKIVDRKIKCLFLNNIRNKVNN